MTFTVTDLAENIYQETKPLADRIDYAWSIFSDDAQDHDDRHKAQEFLIYAFDLRDLTNLNEQLIQLMKERNKYKADNPDFVPGKAPKNLTFDTRKSIPKSFSENVTDWPLKDILDKELLDVNTKSKKSDRTERTTYFTSKGRAQYRIHLRDGKIQKNRKNFDTQTMISHNKKGFGAFTLNSNGELSVFNHHDMNEVDNLVLAHSSMNAGAPVVAAGEIKIKNGVLKAITTHSGHYQPSLFNVYRLLEHFVDHNVDISQAEILTFDNPSVRIHLQTTSTSIHGKNFYATKATALFLNVTDLLEKSLDSISQEVQRYIDLDDEDFWTALYKFKDRLFGSTLTTNRQQYALKLANSLSGLKSQLSKTLTRRQKDTILSEMDKTVSHYENLNRALSSNHGKEETNGRLAESFRQIKAEIRRLKSENEQMNIRISSTESRYKNTW